MNIAQQIVEKIREEIGSYRNSRGKSQKLLYNNTTDALLTKLERFLDLCLNDIDLTAIDIDEFVDKLYSSLGWER